MTKPPAPPAPNASEPKASEPVRRGPRSTPVDRQIGLRIKAARKALHMSTKSLGDQIGVTYQQVQKYEKGTNRITVSRVYALAKALGVDITYFMRELEDAPELDPSSAAAVSLKVNRALMTIHDPEVLAKILAHVEGIAATQPTDADRTSKSRTSS